MNEAIFWGGVLYALGFGLFVKRRRVLDTPTARALSAAIGRTELCGTAHGDPPQPALLSGKPCAYWEVRLYRRERHGRKRTRCIASRHATVGHFWMADASGRMPVLIDGAHWWLDGKTTLRNRRGTAIPGPVREWVRAAGADWDAGDLRIVEQRLEEGGAVYVLGTVSPAHDVLQAPPAARAPRQGGAVRHIASTVFGALFKVPPPDDALSQAVARVRDAGGPDAPAAAGAVAEVPPWLRTPERVAMWKGTRRDPFLIANCAEQRLASRLARWGLGTAGVGSALMLSGVAEWFK